MVSKETFSKMDAHIYKVSRRFLERLHPNKSAKWINQRYYKSDFGGKSKNKWILTDPIENGQLKRMMQTPIIRHIMIKHNASPYDTNLGEYFKMRDKKYYIKIKSILELYVVKATRTVLRRERGDTL